MGCVTSTKFEKYVHEFMSKRYDWMTPEEAARELVNGDCVWYSFRSEKKVALGEYRCDGWCHIHLTSGNCIDLESVINIGRKCVCRTIVPEVPSE